MKSLVIAIGDVRMPLSDSSRAGRQANQPTVASSSDQNTPVQDTRGGSAKHRFRVIRILQDVGSYLADKFTEIKNFFKGLGARDVKKTSSSRFEPPDTSTAFPDLGQRKAGKVKNQDPQPIITREPKQAQQSVPKVHKASKTPKEKPLDATDSKKTDDSQDIDPTLRYRVLPDQPETKDEIIDDRQNIEELSQQQRATPPIISKKSPSRHKKTETNIEEDQQDQSDTEEEYGMASFEKKMNKRGFDFYEYQNKRKQVPEAESTAPKVEEKSLFSKFLSFLGIKTTSSKISRVQESGTQARSVQSTQSTGQYQSNLINSIQKAQAGTIDRLPSYRKAFTEINNQKTTVAKWLPYIFPRYQDDGTKVGGIEYGFADIKDVINFSNNSALFTRLIKCSLNITRGATDSEKSETIHSILNAENCKCFLNSMQIFLDFVQSEDCKNKEVLDGIVNNIAKKDCIKFFSNIIASIDKEAKSTT